MRPTFHTRRNATVPIGAAAALLSIGCASPGGGPIYELRPTPEPLTYALSSEGANEIETPNGLQNQTYRSEAVLSLQIGEASADGHSFTATIESMTLESGGSFGDTSQDLTEELGGKPFHGILGPEGSVSFTESPEFQVGMMSTRDLERVVSGVVFPLPPGGDPSAGAWPHRLALPTGGGLDGESIYEGTMTFVGDTVWAGIPASVMASEGIVSVAATGMPQGAPAEIELETKVEVRTVYIWDPARGVLLEVHSVGQGGGEVMTMGFGMPMAVSSESLLTLQQ